jgi:hypothetical protein
LTQIDIYCFSRGRFATQAQLPICNRPAIQRNVTVVSARKLGPVLVKKEANAAARIPNKTFILCLSTNPDFLRMSHAQFNIRTVK